MNSNIHDYLQYLGAVGPSKPMVLIKERPQLIEDNGDNKRNLIGKLFPDRAKAKKDTMTLKGLNRFLFTHLEELDGRDFSALCSIYNYFKELRVASEAEIEKTWLQNLYRSFETLSAPLTVEAQPALASSVPGHMRTGYRLRIAEQTKLIFKTLQIFEQPMQKGTVIEGGETIDSLDKLIKKAQQQEHSRQKQKTKISVINRDCLDVAAQYNSKPNVTLLNMANANGPGGGWLIGDNAQEEQLFLRTNYHRGLVPELNPFLKKQLSNGRYRIPFFGVIFTPCVTVFRDRENQLLPPKQRFQINMMASAALDLRPYPSNKELADCGGESLDNQIVKTYTKQKIRTQLAASLLHGSEILILGAFGCGAFRHDPSLVAKCYKEVIEEPLFKHAFREIVFSVIDPHNTNNFAEFSKRFI